MKPRGSHMLHSSWRTSDSAYRVSLSRFVRAVGPLASHCRAEYVCVLIMRFVSTRGQTQPVALFRSGCHGAGAGWRALLAGDATRFFGRSETLFGALRYAELCFEFLRVFANDIEPATLRAIVEKSYTTFSRSEIAPLKQLGPRLYVLELFHGPTLAFKDFALQLLGNLYEHQCAFAGRRSTCSAPLPETPGRRRFMDCWGSRAPPYSFCIRMAAYRRFRSGRWRAPERTMFCPRGGWHV